MLFSPLIIGVFVIAALIEGLILYQTKWASPVGSLRDTAVTNLVSGVLLTLLAQLLAQISNVILLIAVAWVLSILVEGFVLMLLRRRTAARSYFAALTVNTAGYIFVLLYVLSFLLT